MLISRINDFHHQLIRPFVRNDDMVVDCTVGNGHDALFLARILGDEGRLFGFDVQEAALEGTRKRLLEAGIAEGRFTLIKDSHARIAVYVPRGIGAAVYNLGYLPGSDHGIVTDRETTISSIAQALGLLRRGGVAGITLYYGHDGGRHEAAGVLDYLKTLDQKDYKALHLHYLNLPNAPPSMVLVQRER